MSESWITQMRKGLAELTVLGLLAEDEAYGYELMKRLEHFPGLALKESTLYLVLARLKKNGYLATRSIPSETGPPRRYFRLTQKGHAQLADMSLFWQALQKDLNMLLSKEGSIDD